MSALGQKRTLPPKADIVQQGCNVPLWPKADIRETRDAATNYLLAWSLVLFQVGEPPRSHTHVGFDYGFDERVFRQIFVVLSYNCLGFL
jgi:hypothetical protein